MMNVRFKLENVTKTYTRASTGRKKEIVTVLRSFNLNIYEKKINALVGESGAGKSTLSRILIRLEGVDSGSLFYRDEPVEDVPIRDFRKKNQILFQNAFLSLNPTFTVEKIVSEPLLIERASRKRIQRKIIDLFSLLEISETVLKRYPSELSGGQLQRIALARALIMEPEFIILDEPLTSLDAVMAARLLLYFKKVFRMLNIGVLYITHNLKSVQFFADWISVINQGRIIAHQPKDRMVSDSELYAFLNQESVRCK